MEPTGRRKVCKQDEHHNKSAHTDNCTSDSVLWAADIQEQLYNVYLGDYVTKDTVSSL